MNFVYIIILLLLGISVLYIINKKKQNEIICEPGFYGSQCQYSDLKTCNGRGKVIVNEDDSYTCNCKSNFEGKNCQKCKTGFIGSKCQYNNFYCNNNGSVSIDAFDNPSCICSRDKGLWYGSRCQYNDSILQKDVSSKCSNNGYYNTENKTCDCLPGYYGKTCSYDDSYCNNNGYISDMPNEKVYPPIIQCRCYPNYAGSRCQYSSNIECKGKGTVYSDENDNSICVCNGNFDGKDCSDCKSGYFGKKENCQYSSQETCNGGNISITEKNTTPTPTITSVPSSIYNVYCSCPEGNNTELRKGKKSGLRCQIDDYQICNNKGYVEEIINENSNPPQVKCKCIKNYGGNNCETCKQGFSGEFCQNAS